MLMVFERREVIAAVKPKTETGSIEGQSVAVGCWRHGRLYDRGTNDVQPFKDRNRSYDASVHWHQPFFCQESMHLLQSSLISILSGVGGAVEDGGVSCKHQKRQPSTAYPLSCLRAQELEASID